MTKLMVFERQNIVERLNEFDSKGWTNLSKEEVNEHIGLTKQLSD